MPQNTIERYRLYLNLLACATLIFGLFFSRAALSIGMIVLVSNSVLHLRFLKIWKQYFRQPEYWLFGLFFLLVAISGFYSENISEFFMRAKGKSAFLLLPIAFFIMPSFSLKQVKGLLLLIFFLCICSAIWSLGLYFQDFESITSSYHQAKVIPTPFHHVRFSLVVAFCSLNGFILFAKGSDEYGKYEKWVWLVGGLFLSVYLHVLAVRSGLAGYYMATITLLVIYIFKQKKYLNGLVGIALIACLPVFAFYTVPSFKKKIEYMKYDLEMYSKEYWNKKNYSDSRRLLSIEVAYRIGMESPVVGHGYGDINLEMKRGYIRYFPNLSEKNYLTPHSQFAFTFVGLGYIGLLILVMMLLYPVLTSGRWKNPVFLAFNIILFSSFFTEHTLEDQFGTAIYLFFLLLLMKHPDF